MGKCPEVSQAFCYLPLKASVLLKNTAYRPSPNLTFYYGISMNTGYVLVNVCFPNLKVLDCITCYIYIFKHHEMSAIQINKSFLKHFMGKDISISIMVSFLFKLPTGREIDFQIIKVTFRSLKQRVHKICISNQNLIIITFPKLDERLPLNSKLNRKCRITSQVLVKLSHSSWPKNGKAR